ncbi:hypothetical protein SLS60_005782 [Paraconiothyrium brasiliense]|uniref:Uncharacterized protein n=1 Tax=Paraconiothyrium brasiliense TaxID=300254 RepID=A0ABR3RD39_9PLEO
MPGNVALAGQCCSGEDNDTPECTTDGINDAGDETPATNAAKIGYELESSTVRLAPEKDGCTETQTDQAKGHLLAGRKGTNWMLTADTLAGAIPHQQVDIEYILNGQNIKLGTSDLQNAANAAAADFKAWNPWAKMKPNSFEIEGNECNNWKVFRPFEVKTDDIPFNAQATAPMPLEAVQDLFRISKTRIQSPLVPASGADDAVYVTKDFFQASPGGVRSDSLKDDTLAFFSIVMSYAKAETDFSSKPGKSIKSTIPIMPRNDFTTIYKKLKEDSAIPTIDGSLWDLVNKLSCYKNGGNDGTTIVYDTEFCDGNDLKDPKPKDGKLEGMIYHAKSSSGEDQCTMKEWIDAVEAEKEDPITRVDKKIDGSVGKFGSRYELVLDTDREVPVFEFRNLYAPVAKEFGKAVKTVEDAIVGYHKKFANGPRKFRRRQDAKYSHIRRNAPRDDCAAPTSTATAAPTTTVPQPTPPPNISCKLQLNDPGQGINQEGCICGSTTLPLLTVTDATSDSQSCDYTALPTSSVSNPISIEHQTYTANCYLCTLIGGIADTPSCATKPVDGCTPTTPAAPTATVFLSNNSVPIGDENNKNNGADLRKDLFNKLKALCPGSASACDSKTPAEFDKVETVTGDEPIEETIKFIIQDSHYNSGQERDQMIAAAVASWQQGVAKSCKEVEYEDTEDLTKSGCGTGNARDGPYANHMNIQLDYTIGHGDSAFNEFICEIIVDGLTALALVSSLLALSFLLSPVSWGCSLEKEVHHLGIGL